MEIQQPSEQLLLKLSPKCFSDVATHSSKWLSCVSPALHGYLEGNELLAAIICLTNVIRVNIQGEW